MVQFILRKAFEEFAQGVCSIGRSETDISSERPSMFEKSISALNKLLSMFLICVPIIEYYL